MKKKMYLAFIVLLIIVMFCPRPFTRVHVEKISHIVVFDSVTGKKADITEEEQIRYFANNWRNSWYIPNYLQYLYPGDGGHWYQLVLDDAEGNTIEILQFSPKGNFLKPFFIIDKLCREEIQQLNYEH